MFGEGRWGMGEGGGMGGRGGRGVGIVASLSSHSPNLCWVTISHYEFGLQPDIRNNGSWELLSYTVRIKHLYIRSRQV